MSDKAQRRLLSILAIIVAAGLGRQLSGMFVEVPEQRGIKDDIKEAAIEGAVRMTSIVIASIVVRQLARSRQGR